MTDWIKIEEKWRSRWAKEKQFLAEPDDKEKKFITVAYPYPKLSSTHWSWQDIYNS